MNFLRRLIGGSVSGQGSDTAADVGADAGSGAGADAGSGPEGDPGELDALERQHELDLARGEQERLDELQLRQERYAQYAWQPPAQGGERRAEDRDTSAGS